MGSGCGLGFMGGGRLMSSISAAAWQPLRRRRRINGIPVEDEEAMCKSRVAGFSFRVYGYEL
ncbi:hypothetical protein Dimus_001975 [Dionaea muscipula]